MDYSHLPNDPDHPAGTSPWQTSPGPNRTTFPSDAESAPSSPNAPKQAPSTSEPPEPREEQSENYSEPPTPTPSAPEDPLPPQTNGTGNGYPRAISQSVPDIRFQPPPMTEEELRQEQIRQQRAQERYQQALHAQQHQRGPGPNRYHGTKPGQRQPPAYKLQAKIISLERLGKKDPAIHFDVHVCSPSVPMRIHADGIRRTSLNSVQLKSEISREPTPNLSSWQTILYLRIPKLSYRQYPLHLLRQELAPMRMKYAQKQRCRDGSIMSAPMMCL